MSLPIIHVDQLQPGIFICLEGKGWLDHPFFFNSFRISDRKQIATLRKLGIQWVAFDPARSTTRPLELKKVPEAVASEPSPEDAQRMAAKQERVERVCKYRERIVTREREYHAAVTSTRSAIEAMLRDPTRAADDAAQLAREIASTFTGDEGVTLTFIAYDKVDLPAFQHATNTMILALTLGRAAGLDTRNMELLGLGAMLHDIGKVKVKSTILMNSQRNAAAENAYRMHIPYGADMVRSVVDPQVLAVIAGHHERADGKGFPAGHVLDQIDIPTRIVAIANRYDNLCNPIRIAEALTPAEALARMFAKESNAFDSRLLSLFIRELGVYPPGSFVQLSNGALGMIVGTNSEMPLKPSVMIYEPATPRSEALIIDMKDEPEVKVESTLRPHSMDKAVIAYLNPRMRMAYFAEKQ
ncbi:MAG: DUF3391 domain-containing protein [Betaproteobacteria bacterium]|nr:DUF3391 domain-containing protein [Betaproteobacteria bacterium]